MSLRSFKISCLFIFFHISNITNVRYTFSRGLELPELKEEELPSDNNYDFFSCNGFLYPKKTYIK